MARLGYDDFMKQITNFYDNNNNKKILSNLIKAYNKKNPFIAHWAVWHDLFVNYYINSTDLDYNRQTDNYNIYVIISGVTHTRVLDSSFKDQGYIDVPITVANMSIKNYLIQQNIVDSNYNDFNKIKELLKDYFKFKLSYNVKEVEEVKGSNPKKYKLVEDIKNIETKLSNLNNHIDEKFEVNQIINLQCKYPLPNKGDLISTLYLKYLFDNSKANGIVLHDITDYIQTEELSYEYNDNIYIYKVGDAALIDGFLKGLNINVTINQHIIHNSIKNICILTNIDKINLLTKCPYCIIWYNIDFTKKIEYIKNKISISLKEMPIEQNNEKINKIYDEISDEKMIRLLFLYDQKIRNPDIELLDDDYNDNNTANNKERITNFYELFGINIVIDELTDESPVIEKYKTLFDEHLLKIILLINQASAMSKAEHNISDNNSVSKGLCNVMGGDYTINCASIFVLLNKFWYVLVIVLLVILFYYIIKNNIIKNIYNGKSRLFL